MGAYNKTGSGALILKLPAVSGSRVDTPFPLPLWIGFAPLRFLFGRGEIIFGPIEAALPSLFWNVFQPPSTTEEIAMMTLDFIESETVDARSVEVSPFDLYRYQSG